jgi:hypothetical protein
MTPNDRMRMYLQHLLLDRNPAKELRTFQLAPFLRRRYDTSTTSESPRRSASPGAGRAARSSRR